MAVVCQQLDGLHRLQTADSADQRCYDAGLDAGQGIFTEHAGSGNDNMATPADK